MVLGTILLRSNYFLWTFNSPSESRISIRLAIPAEGVSKLDQHTPSKSLNASRQNRFHPIFRHPFTYQPSSSLSRSCTSSFEISSPANPLRILHSSLCTASQCSR